MKTEKIHSWDAGAVLISLVRAAVIEGFAIAPLVISGIGHAGPNGVLGNLSIFLNIPGLFVVILVTPVLSAALSLSDGFAWLIAYIVVYVTQVLLLGYALFIFVRRRKIHGAPGKTIVTEFTEITPLPVVSKTPVYETLKII